MTRFTPTFPVAETPDDRMKRESFERAQQEETAGGFVENFFNRGQESAPAFLTRQIYRNTVFPDDPNFKLDEKFFEELTRGLPDSVWHRFTDARSMDQAYSIRNDLLQTQDRRQTLAASGMTGTAAAIFADLVEPSNLALGLATGGISNLSRLNAARRLSLMAEEGKITGDAFKAAIAAASRANATTVATEAALGAVGFGGIEAYKATQDPFTTTGDVIAGSLGGLGFGAASEALAGLNRFTRAPMVGLAGAVGPGFVQAAQGVESDQINESFWLAFAQGAAFSLAHGKRGPLLDKLTMDTYAAAADAWKVQEADLLKNIQDDYITDAGRRTIKEAEAILDRNAMRVRQTIDGPEELKTTIAPPEPKPNPADAAIGIDGLADLVDALPLPDVPAFVDEVATPIRNNYGPGVSADVIAQIEGNEPSTRHEIVSRIKEEQIAFRSARSGSPKPTEGLGSSSLNITTKPSVLLPEDVIAQNYSYAEFRGESVDLPTARALVTDLNKNVGGREYAVVQQNKDAYTVASRPTVAIEGKLTDMINAAKKRRQQLAIPRGRTSGATILFDELVSYAYELALRAARAGVKTAGDVASYIRDTVKNGDARYHADVDKLVRMASAHWEDGKGTVDGVADAIRRYDSARESGIRVALFQQQKKQSAVESVREAFARQNSQRAQATTNAFSAEGKHLSLEEQAALELKEFQRREKKLKTDFDASKIRDVPEPALAIYKEISVFGKTYRLTAGGMTAGDIVGGSKIQTFRDLAARMTHDPIPRDGNHTYYDAMTSKTKKIGARDAKIERAMSDAYAKHAEYAKGRGEKPLARDHFFEAAGVHRVRGLSSPDPGIEAARTASTAFYNDTLAMRKRFGDADAEATPEDATYMERVYNAPVIRDLTLAAVPGEIERALAEFTISATPDMDPRVAALMGRAAAKRGRNADQHFADPTHDIVRLPASELVDALKNELGDLLKPEDIALVEGHIKSKADKASGDANRKRIGMDYNHPVDIRLKDGTTKTITLTDLLVNNLENNLHSNNHRSESMAHFYDVMKATFPNNEVRTITAFERRLHQLAEETGDTAGKHTGDIEKLVAMGKNVLGVPQYQSNPVVRGMRALRNIGSFLGLTNVTSGLTQIPEATDAMSFAGSRAVAKLMPELPKIIKEVAAGKYENADLRAMLDGGSAALSMWNDRIHRNLDFEASGPASAAELGIKKGTQFGLTYFSGVRPMQAGLESFAGYGVLYSFSDRAFNPDRAFTDLDLRDMGLTPDEYKAINAQIVKYGDAESLSIGREKWDDPEAIGAFHRAFDLTTRRLVLSRDASDLPHWAANTAWGQTLAQFRSFSLMAWRNKTMYGVHRFRNGDASYANRLLLTSAANAVVYAANVGLRGLGKPDAGEWYEDKLSPEEVLKASFSRAAYASIIPMAIDTISSRAGYGDVFSGARTTELRGGLLDGNPTYNYLNNLWHAPSSIIGPMLPGNDYRFSKRDAIRLRDLVLPNVLGVRNAIEHLIEDLPATPEQARK